MATKGIKEISLGTDDNYLIEPTLYTTVKQTSTATAFTADLDKFQLFKGVTVAVKFGANVTNNASATLNINGTGAKAIYYEGAAIAANKLQPKRTYIFTYNDAQWELVGDLDTNTQSDYGNITTSGKIGTGNNLVVTSSGTVQAGATISSAISTQTTSTKFLREDGAWAAPSYTTNIDEKVSQIGSTDDKNFPIILKNTDGADETSGVKYSNNTNSDVTKTKPFTFNPSTGTLIVSQIKIGTKDDNMGLFPNLNNWNQIGSSSLYWYRAYINNYYGDRSHITNWDAGKNIGTAATSSTAATKGSVNFYNTAAAGATQTKTLLEANTNTNSNITITLPNSTGNLALVSDIPTKLSDLEKDLTYSDFGAAAASHGTHVTMATVKSALGIVSPTAKKFLKDTGDWTQVDWGDLTGIPSSFTPGIHEHEYIGKNHYIAYPSDGAYDGSGTITGYIKIKIPETKSATMFSFDVDIYNYVSDTTTRYHISGYNYTDASWNNCTAYCIAPFANAKANLSVRFLSNDNDEMYVTIGETDTSWSYPKIVIHNITLGHSNATLAKWKTGWTITISNTAFETTQIKRTITNTNIAMQADIADKATAANLTTTANAIAYYTDTTGTFSSKASADGALYATSTNGSLQWGTLPIAQGGTGKTTANDAANALISGLPTWTASPTADTYFIRRDTGGTAAFGQVKFSSIANITNGVITLGPYSITPVTSVNGHTGSSVNVTAGDLGLSSALRYQGTTTTAMEDGRTTAAVTIGGDSFTPTQGDVVLYNDAEYVWTGSLWELLGAESSFKKVQTAVNSSSASGNSATTFVSSVTQDTQGVITVKTSTLNTSGTWSGTATYASYIKSPDTRAVEIAPQDLDANSIGVRFDFKQKSITSLKATYSGVMSYRPYSHNNDWSGGPAHQLAFDENGMHWRKSTDSTTWGTWNQLVTITDQTAVGDTNTPVYVDANGIVQACTAYADASVNYATSADKVNAANLITTTNALAYYTNTTGTFGNASKITVYNDADITVQGATKKCNGLHLYGTTYGNTASDLTSNTVGVMRFEDGGPRIEFSETNNESDSGAILFTNHDCANTGGGSSFHFVGKNSSNNTGGNLAVTAPDFVARRRMAVGYNFTDASYALKVLGASLFSGNFEIRANTIRLRNGNNDNNQAGSNPYITSLMIGDSTYVAFNEFHDDWLAIQSKGLIFNVRNSPITVYDATKTYAVGAVVWYDKNYYICKTAIETAEAWNANHWTIRNPSGAILSEASIIPWSNNTYTLGNSSYKWNDIYTTTLNTGYIKIPHTAGSSTELQITYSTTIDYWWGVGTANVNHGMYDNKANKWIIYAAADNNWSFTGNAATATSATIAKYTKQYYTVNSTDAPLQVRSNNKNVYIWQAGHATSESGGFSNNYALQYYSEGSSPNNYLILKTSNSNTIVDAIKIDELGNTIFTNTILGTIKHATAAHWSTTAGSQSGVLKVKIKKKAGWMLAFTIRVYQAYDYTDIGISGYNYGSSLWYSPKARIISSTSTDKLTVSFGYDDDAVNNYRTLWVSIPVKQYTGIDVFNVTNGYTQIDLSDAFEIIQETTSTGTVQTTTDVYRPLYRDDSLETTNLAGDVFKWQTTSLASTALYDFGAYVAQNTAGGTGPNGSNYYNLINIPYRKASGNTKLDWGWQLGNTTSNDNRLYYRTTGDNTAGDWQTIAHATTSSNNTGSARQPVYMTSAGVITAGNNTVAHFGNNPGKTNMNDIGRLYASTGMVKLTSTGNADTPKNGDTYTTDWHLYWDTCYQDDPSGSNAWVAQIVNKAGTNNWWVRSRSGSTITDGTAWASTWRHLVTSTEAAVGNSTTPVYIDANGAVQSCTAYSSASVNYATSAGSATTASNVTQSSSTADLARPIWFCYQENNSYILGRAGYNTNFMYNPGTKTITIGSGSLSETEYSGNAATATSASKISAKLATTTKTYLLGTATTITATAANVSLTGDTGIYLTTTAGELSAVRHSWNVSGAEKAYTTYNSTDDSIDFIFI